MEITDNIHSLAQQLFQLIQHQEMEITINQQTIRYQDTRKTLQLRTKKKTENMVDKIIAKDRPEILHSKGMDMVTSNQLGKITKAQFEELQTQITQEFQDSYREKLRNLNYVYITVVLKTEKTELIQQNP
ncbi:hypothetical protein G9A89_005094 [Geosiphon pyriformis]|nr:hypothetical protein G9A89_005094 [Geosiphon pyriformis]